MFMRILLFFLMFGSNQLFGQALERSLSGFAIGQSKEIPIKVLGKPYLSDTSINGNAIEAFRHPMGDGWVIVFEYNKEKKPSITSIQLSSQKEAMPAGFYGLNFGMNKVAIQKLIGKPSDKVSIGEYGEKWIYEKEYFSLDLDNKGNLWAIKLFEPNYSKESSVGLLIPSIKNLMELKTNKDLSRMAEFISPSLIVFKNAKKYEFLNPWNVELSSDASGIFRMLDEALGLANLADTLNPKSYKQAVIPVKSMPSKFKMSFKNKGTWVEFLWAYEFGSYRIVEMFL